MRVIPFFLVVAIGSGCSMLDWSKRPMPAPTIVQVPELYCPAIIPIKRPEPVEQSAPEFMAITKSDPRLDTAALICLTDEGYRELAEMMEAMVIYGGATQATLRYYEEAIDRQQEEEE